MSGVNWTRRKPSPSACESALTASVLATPGGPSSSTCPPVQAATSARSTVCSCPTTTRPTWARTRSKASIMALPSSSLMRARPRAAASAAGRLVAPCTIACGLVLAQPQAPRGRQQLVVAARRPGRAGGCAPPPRRARSRRPAGPSARARPRGRRRTPPAAARARALRLRRPEAPTARQHERRTRRAPSSTSAPLEAPGHGAPAARAAEPVHALEERDRPPRAGDALSANAASSRRARRLLSERRGICQQHRASRADPRDRGQRGATARRPPGTAEPAVDEAPLDAGRERAHAGRLGQRSERARHPERRAGPRGRIGHDPPEPGLRLRRRRPRAGRRARGSAGARAASPA